MTNPIKISLKKVVGKGYGKYWNYKGRYRVVKGGRGSKKSTTTALNMIYRIIEYLLYNLLVVRKVFKDHKDSTYAHIEMGNATAGSGAFISLYN